MKSTSEFITSLSDVFALFGAIETKRMFGGYGVYRDGLMFALVADDVLYLKADESSVGAFIELGMEPFEYAKKGKRVQMAYYAAPEEIFENPIHAKEWADRAYATALRAKRLKGKASSKRA